MLLQKDGMNSQHLRLAALALAAFTATACATREDRLAAWRDRCATDFGLARGSEAHGLCVMRHDLHRQQLLAQSPQPAPIIIPTR